MVVDKIRALNPQAQAMGEFEILIQCDSGSAAFG
jgi:hypothetical protein